MRAPGVEDFWFLRMRERGDGEQEYAYLQSYAPPQRDGMRWGMRLRYIGPKTPNLRDEGTLT